MDELLKISIEDLEDIGFFRLGHQKRLLLGIKKVKELKKLGQVPPRQFHLGPAPLPPQSQTSGAHAPAYHPSPGGKNLHYYPEQMNFQSLPPVAPSSQHR